jgi:hypothetical protein
MMHQIACFESQLQCNGRDASFVAWRMWLVFESGMHTLLHLEVRNLWFTYLSNSCTDKHTHGCKMQNEVVWKPALIYLLLVKIMPCWKSKVDRFWVLGAASLLHLELAKKGLDRSTLPNRPRSRCSPLRMSSRTQCCHHELSVQVSTHWTLCIGCLDILITLVKPIASLKLRQTWEVRWCRSRCN